MTVTLATRPGSTSGDYRAAPALSVGMEPADDEESIMLKGPDGVIRPLKDRLRTLCKQRRIRLQEFFKPFDVHHNKKVSKGQFRRALDQAGLTAPTTGVPASSLLTVKEVEVLMRRYEVKTRGKDDDADVNYGKLCDQIEKVFTLRGLEKNPTLDVKLALEGRPGSGYGPHRPGLSAEEADAVTGLLARVRLLAATEGLTVKTQFETFDKRHSGRVTSAIFLRQLDSMFKGTLSKAQVRLLLRAYQTKSGDVSYRAMSTDCGNASVSAIDPPDDQVRQLQLQRQRHQQQQQQHQQQTQKKQHEPRCEHLSPSSGSTNGPADSPEVCVRDGDYDDDSSSVVSSVTGFPSRDAVGFNVEDGVSTRRENGMMVGMCGGGGGGLGHGGERRVNKSKNMSVGSESSLPIERQMASKVVYHRLQPEDAFTSYDPTRSGTVTEAVFRRGLSDAFRMPFSEAHLTSLAQRYRCGKNRVSFRRMCDYVCAVAESASFGHSRLASLAGSVSVSGSEEPVSFPGEAGNDDLSQDAGRGLDVMNQAATVAKALEEIRATLHKRRLALQPGFQDFDKKGEGYVSVGQLERVLCAYGVLPANKKTVALLMERYAATDDPHHPAGVFVAYRRLLEDLGEGPRGAPDGRLEVGHEDDRGGGARGPRHRNKNHVRVGDGGCVEEGGDVWDGCHYGSSSVGSGTSSSVAAFQLKVFGKPTGLSRPAHSVVSEVSMTSSVVLGKGRDRGVEELLAQLKALTFRSRLRTLEFFRCDDPMRSGSISREKFGRGLLSTGFRFSPVELERVCNAYADDTVVDKGGAPFVRYARLVEEVEGVFGVKELERKPECDVDAYIHAAQAFFTSSPGAALLPPEAILTAEEDAMVMDALREIGAQAHRRRLSLFPVMKDFDRFNRGVVPGAMFERALSAVGVLPGRRKTKLLRRKFAERFSSPDARSDLNYKAFLAAIDLVMAGQHKIPDQLLVRANANANGNTCSSSTISNGTNTGSTGNQPAAAAAEIATAASKQDKEHASTAWWEKRNGDGSGGDGGGGGGGVESSLEGVVREVSRQLAVGWADITDFLSDADRLKQGEVSLPKLKVALALAGVLLTDEELRMLEDGFRSDRSKDMIFNSSEGMTTSYGCSRHPCPSTSPTSPSTTTTTTAVPTSNPQQKTRQAQRQRRTDDAGVNDNNSNRRGNSSAATSGTTMVGSGGSLMMGEDAVDSEMVRKALDAVRHRVKHRRMNLKPSFQDFDPNRKKKITRQQFMSVLGNMNLSLTEREQDAICRRYTVHERSPGARVRYTSFCDDVEPAAATVGAAVKGLRASPIL